MNILEQLERIHSKESTDQIVAYIGSDQHRFDDLMKCFFHPEWRICQRAAWPMNFVARKHPSLLKKYHSRLIKTLTVPAKHDAVLRNIVRVYQDIPIPKRHQGSLFDAVLDLSMSTKQAKAIRAFSLSVLLNIAKDNPELAPELLIILEEFPGELSVGLRKRLEHVIAKMQKLSPPES